MSDDDRLCQRVRKALADDLKIDAEHLKIAIFNGLATLSGFIENNAQEDIIARAVRRVPGVHVAILALTISPPGAELSADGEIARRALRVLAWRSLVPDSAVTVTVNAGVVSLEGVVEWPYQRDAAEFAVRRLGGVRDVRNGIRIEAPGIAATRDAQSGALDSPADK